MKLPNCDRAEISPEKLRRYLLSTEHPIGRFKARFFRSLGYSAENWERLAEDLVEAARSCDAEMIPSPFGEKYRIVATMVGPAGRSADVVSVWIVSPGNPVPRLVTAYPLE